MTAADILLPTINRLDSLIFTLGGVAAQTRTDIHVIVADQSDVPAIESCAVSALCRIIEARGGRVSWKCRAPRRGIAEQRDFLLRQASAPAVLYLDDDVYMEPWVVDRLLTVLSEQDCGFVGAFPAGLSYRDARRPDEEVLEPWDGPVRSETIEPNGPGWERFNLHRAGNVYHAARHALGSGQSILYKVAWIASCILYDRVKLEAVGGFSFWDRLPRYHSGEEVLVQNLLQRRWGGCAVLPSGTYFSESPTTVLNEAGAVDGHALDLLPEMIARYTVS